MEPNRDEILDLIVRWEEARAQGQDLSPEELCRDCPDLLGEFRRQVEKLGQVDWLDRPHRSGRHRNAWVRPAVARRRRPAPDAGRALPARRPDRRGRLRAGLPGVRHLAGAAGGREGAPGGPPRHRRRGGPVPDGGPQGGPAAAPEHRAGA